MEKPRIRHIAVNVRDPEKTAEYYKKTFGLEEQLRGENGTIYLSDGFVDLALISTPRLPWRMNHFDFQVESVEAVVETANTTAEANVSEPLQKAGSTTRRETVWTYRSTAGPSTPSIEDGRIKRRAKVMPRWFLSIIGLIELFLLAGVRVAEL